MNIGNAIISHKVDTTPETLLTCFEAEPADVEVASAGWAPGFVAVGHLAPMEALVTWRSQSFGSVVEP